MKYGVDYGYKLCKGKQHQGRRWLPVSYFHTHGRTKSGATIRLQSSCITCQRIRTRERKGYKPYSPSKLGLRTGKGGYIIETEAEREIYNRYQRERYRNRTPEQIADRREYDRIRAESIRRKNGAKPRKSKSRKGGRMVYRTYSIEPLRDYVSNLPESIQAELDRKTRNSILKGEPSLVSLDFIDWALVQLGEPWMLDELYPMDSPAKSE